MLISLLERARPLEGDSEVDELIHTLGPCCRFGDCHGLLQCYLEGLFENGSHSQQSKDMYCHGLDRFTSYCIASANCRKIYGPTNEFSCVQLSVFWLIIFSP